jgi:uncharacterized protein
MSDRYMHPSRQDAESLVETAKLVYAAFARRDMGAVLAVLAPDVVWGEPDNPHNPAAGTRHGHDGFLEWARIGQEVEDILELEPKRFLADSETVAVVGHLRCRARATGKTYASDFVHLVGFKDGKIAAFQEFFDTYAAAEAFQPTSE